MKIAVVYGSAAVIMVMALTAGAVACALRACTNYAEISAPAFVLGTLIIGTLFWFVSKDRPL